MGSVWPRGPPAVSPPSITGNSLSISADYLFHFNLLGKSAFKLDAYAGIGVYFWNWFDDNEGDGNDDKEMWGLGVEVPLGIAFIFSKLPIDIYLQATPGWTILGRGGFGIGGSIGFRYYF